MTHKQNNLKVSKPMEARRLRSRRNIINKNNYDLQQLRKQKRFSRPDNMAVYGDKIDFFKKMS